MAPITVDPGLAETESDESSAEEEKQIPTEEPEAKSNSNTTKKKSSYKPRGQRQLDPNIPNIPAFFVFTALRDLMSRCKEKSADFDEIIQRVKRDSQIMGQVLPQYDVVRFIDLALKFLRAPPASTSPPAGKQNPDALVSCESSTGWKWIGIVSFKFCSNAQGCHLEHQMRTYNRWNNYFILLLVVAILKIFHLLRLICHVHKNVY
jgi:hypothetical protein